MKEVYLDHAASTFVDQRVKRAMDRYWWKDFGNPGSFHSAGLRALKGLESARQAVSSVLDCLPEEIIFTGSGSESINLAIQGIFRAGKKKHIVVSCVEHHAVLETCRYLEKYEGARITVLPVDRYGQISPKQLDRTICSDTVLVSVMYANNEVGTINNILELAKVAKKHNVLFHTDACQAGAFLDINVKHLGVDLLTLNGSKVYGPKGIGILFVRKGVDIHPLIHGGNQEFGLRSGTESVPLIVGFAKALELAQKTRKKESVRLSKLRDRLIVGIINSIPKVVLNGHPKERLPNNVNFSFLDVEGEALLLHLNEYKIYASTGSACSSKSLEPSHVVLSLGCPREVCHGSVRFSLGRNTTKADVDRVLKVLPGIVDKLRRLSPVRLNYG